MPPPGGDRKEQTKLALETNALRTATTEHADAILDLSLVSPSAPAARLAANVCGLYCRRVPDVSVDNIGPFRSS
jgi:hypothetical protein